MIRVVMEGMTRARVLEFVQTDPFYLARIEVLPDLVERDVEVEALVRSVISQFEKCVELGKTIPRRRSKRPARPTTPGGSPT